MSSVFLVCVFLVCFSVFIKWLARVVGLAFSRGPCCTVFSFRWFKFFQWLVFGQPFYSGIPSFSPRQPGICFQLATFSPSPAQRKKEMHRTTPHWPTPAHGWLQGCMRLRQAEIRGINRTLQYLSLKELARKKRTLLPTGSIQGRKHNSARCCKARTRGRDLQALGRFPPPLFQYLKPTCSYTSPSHYYHALQSWTPRHGTSTFTSPCLATTPPDMASYACLIYIPCLLLLIHICLCAVDNCVYVNKNNTTRSLYHVHKTNHTPRQPTNQ